MKPPAEAKYFEDLPLGAVRESGERTVSAEEIIAFAREFDPEPFHTDPAAARESMFGGLVASGVHTFAIWRRLNWESAQAQGFVFLAGLGFDEMRLLRPVRPGDVLHLRSELIEKTPSRSKPDRGVVRYREALVNQHGEVVMTVIGRAMAARRPR